MNERTYNRNAEEYLKVSFEQEKWATEFIGKLALKGDESVLDIRCGDGRMTAEISRPLSAGFALGVDSSENMIRFAQQRCESARQWRRKEKSIAAD